MKQFFQQNRKVYLLKYAGPESDVRNANVIVLRLSEAYLNAAESAVKTSDNTKATTYLEAIVKELIRQIQLLERVALEQVIKERRKEFVGEGHRQFDAMRNNETVSRIGGWHIPGLIPEVQSYNRDYFHAILPIQDMKRMQTPIWCKIRDTLSKNIPELTL
ncbi:MAG: RagB/SusD family nutrient uptake outer membrane protein [Marinilabiliales bacterium]|nr:RagB/SusD family nutrient uptake outer membrane protein [Marinilabiliales bacterium]